MPTYVYRFLDSDETIEVHQSFTDAALTEAVHPVTGDVQPVRKVFTPVGITFKGKGFYKTDSRGSSSSTSTSKSSDTKTESKSDTSSSSSNGDSGSSTSSSSSSSSTSGLGWVEGTHPQPRRPQPQPLRSAR